MFVIRQIEMLAPLNRPQRCHLLWMLVRRERRAAVNHFEHDDTFLGILCFLIFSASLSSFLKEDIINIRGPLLKQYYLNSTNPLLSHKAVAGKSLEPCSRVFPRRTRVSPNGNMDLSDGFANKNISRQNQCNGLKFHQQYMGDLKYDWNHTTSRLYQR